VSDVYQAELIGHLSASSCPLDFGLSVATKAREASGLAKTVRSEKNQKKTRGVVHSTSRPHTSSGKERTVLAFVRHAEAVWTGKRLPGRLPGVMLSSRGRRQAEVVAEDLAALPIEAVYTSPLDRTLETAEVIAKRLGTTPLEADELIEADCGEWAGRTFKQVVRLRSFKTLPRHAALRTPPGGESIAAVQARMLGFVEYVREKHPGKLVIAVSHADPIKAAVAGLIGLPLELFSRLEIGVASVTAVTVEEWPLLLCANADGRRFGEIYRQLTGEAG
jgi:probable phosphoglycerate mutase